MKVRADMGDASGSPGTPSHQLHQKLGMGESMDWILPHSFRRDGPADTCSGTSASRTVRQSIPIV